MDKQRLLGSTIVLFVLLCVVFSYQNNTLKKIMEGYNYLHTEDLKNRFQLLELGYTDSDIKLILKDNVDIEYFLKNYISDIRNYLSNSLFKFENIDRYLTYFNGNYHQTMLEVNIGVDLKPYSILSNVDSYSELMIVNKWHTVSPNFVPEQLVSVKDCGNQKDFLSKSAADAYLSLCHDLRKKGISITVNSAYRNYQEQEEVYQYFLDSRGQKYTEDYVSYPGFSEHQTGLAVDIKDLHSDKFIDSQAYQYLLENADQYGFILRYPEGKEYLTGYQPESWHYRYVGKAIATEIKNAGLTFEEYYALYLD